MLIAELLLRMDAKACDLNGGNAIPVDSLMRLVRALASMLRLTKRMGRPYCVCHRTDGQVDCRLR